MICLNVFFVFAGLFLEIYAIASLASFTIFLVSLYSSSPTNRVFSVSVSLVSVEPDVPVIVYVASSSSPGLGM